MPPESTQQSNDPAPEHIAALLAACGVEAFPVGVTSSVSVNQYNFRLASLKDFAKARKSTEAISARLNRQAIFSRESAGDFAITVPRATRATLPFKRVILTQEYAYSQSATQCILGADTHNRAVTVDIASLPHLLIAGATGSGKSVLLHTIICSMLFKATPSSVEFILFDPKRIELSAYAGIPHLAIPIITDTGEAIQALKNVCRHMDERYKGIKDHGATYKKLVIVIDELADLMMVSRKAVEPAIVRIAQLGRAAGIHLLLATQRPTVNVCTGLIKANIPARIALTMASYRDAGVIEIPGANKLSGLGDALYQSPNHTIPPTRFQVAYISPYEIQQISGFWRSTDCKIAIA